MARIGFPVAAPQTRRPERICADGTVNYDWREHAERALLLELVAEKMIRGSSRRILSLTRSSSVSKNSADR